jgi:signal transduction histidine kinase/putative methionine-R-sulfoxide reductase with GAF domain
MRAKKGYEPMDTCPSKSLRESRFEDKQKVIILFLVGSISAYLIDSAVDSFIYHEGSFLDVLTLISPETFSARLYILLIFAVLSVLTYKLLTSRRSAEERLSALNSYTGRLNIEVSIQEIYELTVDAMKRALSFENAAFLTVEKDKLQVACHFGCMKPQPPEIQTKATRGITVRVAKTRKPVLTHDVSQDDRYVACFPNTRSQLAVPIVAEDRILGVLDVESTERAAFSERDVTLLQILASHAGTAISNSLKRGEAEKRSDQMTLLLKRSAEVIHAADLHRRLQTIAEAISDLGWRRVVISVRDENMEMKSPDDMVTVGVTDEERQFLWNNRPSGLVMRERFGPEYERFRIGEFYYLPWSNPWVRSRNWMTSTIQSHLNPEEMVDWNPQDSLYAPIRLVDGPIVGRLSIDDPSDGKRPSKESLAPLELFLGQAAVAIENAQLIQQLNEAKSKIQEYADNLETKVAQRTLELEQTQKRLLTSERLATIGELAGMVGHDLRNPLTSITGATYYLKTKLGQNVDPKTKEMLEIIEKDVEFSNKIINDLLDYSREINLELTEKTPKEILKEALSLVEIPEKIEIIDLTEKKTKMKVDADKMKRVFVNIIKNAVDAMPKGGILTIRTKKSIDHWEIAFSDTGIGIKSCMLTKIWSPLYTTKAKGMGFGLSICKRIVEAHRGKITIKSEIAKGTTFTISVPRIPPTGKERIHVNLPECRQTAASGAQSKTDSKNRAF